MPCYQYRALDSRGAIVQGKLEAASERALETQLRQSGVELLRCAELTGRVFLRRRRVPRKELIGFCFHMEQMTRAGLPILEALADLRDSVDHPVLAEVLGNLISSVEVGQSLSQSMARHPGVFDEVFVNLIAVGEQSGELSKVLQKLTESLKWQDELIAKARTVIIYPAFVALVVVSVMLFMMLFVVPQMVDFLQEMGQELPLHTRALIAFSNFLVNHWWWVVPAPLFILLGLKFHASRSVRLRYSIDSLKLGIWYLGPLTMKIVLSRFANYFALCYSAGLDVLVSLRIGETIAGNVVLQKGIQQIGESIAEGRSLSESIRETALFPPLVVRMVRMGESTGALDSALENVSYFYDREVSESIERLQSLVEPAMTVVLGAIMAWIMLSVLGPIYDTMSELGV